VQAQSLWFELAFDVCPLDALAILEGVFKADQARIAPSVKIREQDGDFEFYCIVTHPGSASSSRIMEHVFDDALKQAGNVLIVEGIENLPAALVWADQPHLAQCSQMVRDCRWADAHGVRQSVHVLQISLQSGDNLHPAGIAKDAEQLGDLHRHVIIDLIWGEGFIFKWSHRLTAQCMNICSDIAYFLWTELSSSGEFLDITCRSRRNPPGCNLFSEPQ
jgi:hypothetical protein